MKKILMFISLLFSAVTSLATSSLDITSFPKSYPILASINLSHNDPTISGYFKIVLDYAIRDNTQENSHSQVTIRGEYSSYFNKKYIVDLPSDRMKGDIASVNAALTFYTCVDKAFNFCSIVEHYRLAVDFTGDKITALYPDKFDINL
jgi:hypothetical protein